jgi:dihydrofolate synthase/folylpolyglutamate synthase
VGLGGRLDATNVVPRLAAAITSIDFDHQAQLGPTIESIASEKAGVIRPGIPVICGELQPAAAAVIEGTCRNLGARYVPAGDFSDLAIRHQLPEPRLRGVHQRHNAAVAVRLLLELRSLGISVDDQAIGSGLTEVVWPGRLELLRYGRSDVLIDAAHNPAGARALAAYLRDAGWAGECALIFGAMQDKDVDGMLTELAAVCPAIICTTADTPRAREAASLAAAAGNVAGAAWQVSQASDPAEALTRAAASFRRVVVAGSIFLIGPLRGILRAR